MANNKSPKFFEHKDFDIALFVNVLHGIYKVYYDSCDYGEEYKNMIWKGIALTRDNDNAPLLCSYTDYSNDVLTSDRELAAFAVTYEIYQKRYETD